MQPSVEEKVRKYFSTFPRRSYPKGQILVFADENPSHIFYIVSGRVRKYDISYRGDEVIVNVFKPPSFFPMSWAINRAPNKYFYKTESATDLHIVPVDDAYNFIRANPDVALDLLSRIYRGLEGMLGRVVHLMSGTARSRLIYELLIECRRFGEPQQQGGCLLHINEVDLAARSGLSRETISREIRKLKTQGWIGTTDHGIHITNITKLEQSLGSEL